MRLVVADTSCLIIFTRFDRIDILRGTFSELVTTDRVVAEFGAVPDWIAVITKYDQEVCRELMQDLGPGESSCIAVALGQERPLLIAPKLPLAGFGPCRLAASLSVVEFADCAVWFMPRLRQCLH